MNIIKKYTSVNLILRIAIGLGVGAALGFLMTLAINNVSAEMLGGEAVEKILRGVDTIITVIGMLFVGALRGVAPVLVFFLVSSSLMNSKTGQGKTIKTQILLYVLGTFFAALTALIINYIFKIHLVLPQDVDTSSVDTSIGLTGIITNLFTNIVTNPLAALVDSNYLGILFWAIMFGIAVRAFATKGFKEGFDIITNAITKIVRFIIECAPFGICGLVYAAVRESGIGIFTDYGALLLVYVCCILLIAFIMNPLIVFLAIRRNPYPLLWQTIKKSAITAFFFRSSAANIPFNMALCDELGLDKDNYSISIPLGSTINMEGAAITIITLTLSCCFTLGLQIDVGTALILSIIATVSAAGASGVSGGSILLVPMGCSLFGIGSDIAAAVVSIGFIIGVVQDSLETALNSSTDVLFTATGQFREKIKNGEPVSEVVGGTVKLKEKPSDVYTESASELPAEEKPSEEKAITEGQSAEEKTTTAEKPSEEKVTTAEQSAEDGVSK